MDLLPRIQIIADCPRCPHIFKSQKQLRFHVKNEHGCTFPNIRSERLHPTVCLVCAVIFKNKHELFRHLVSSHKSGEIKKEGRFKVVLKRLEMKFYKNQRIVFC